MISLTAANSDVAASSTNTSRELGVGVGVGVGDSIVNGRSTVNLVNQLIAIGIFEAWRAQIIVAVTTDPINAPEKK